MSGLIDPARLVLAPSALAGGRILITGGGTGLGRIMAETCAILGARVYICGRRGALLDQAAADINAAIGAERVCGLPCDIRSAESITAMVDGIWADGGALTGLVNNAAANFIARAKDVSPGGFDAIASTVYRGTWLMTQDVGRRWLAEGKRGAVVSILTTWVWSGGPFATPAAMAKAGVQAMTQSLAVEWGRSEIRLNNICPGAFPTEGMAARLRTDDQGFKEGNRASNAFGRNGRPEELANAVAFLLSDGGAFISGQTIAVDAAGWQMGADRFTGLLDWSDADWAEARDKIRAADARDKAARTVDVLTTNESSSTRA